MTRSSSTRRIRSDEWTVGGPVAGLAGAGNWQERSGGGAGANVEVGVWHVVDVVVVIQDFGTGKFRAVVVFHNDFIERAGLAAHRWRGRRVSIPPFK